MNLKRTRAARGLIVGAAILGLAGAAPAFAEGSRTTYISKWTAGGESSRWTDNNRDSVSTSVGFSGCTTDGWDGFKAAGLILHKDVFGPDPSKGFKTNYCNRVYWGDVEAGSYYFKLDGFTTGSYLWVNSVGISY
ncbi:hypothetical protein [Streptomyces sp. NRRL S-118]|uniref:hypothetical protein n=1 Tax=Streptomyces sp. NRRL S-118 TaxID=1463881 RepID=UPI0004C7FBF3|nr:hypothetical protein [Streptomyces sp. NRRL S-118]